MKVAETIEFMRTAILVGRQALPHCLPNPPVGCVIVQNGSIVSKGYTNPPGQWHAEAMALSEITGDLQNTTLFVTLEPCSFYGRTPSCAKEIVSRGISSVYVGTIDPHPGNQGKGVRILEDAGIRVEVGLLEQEVLPDLTPYLHSQI